MSNAIAPSINKKAGITGLFIVRRQSKAYNPASAFSASALSVASQVKSASSRPKWP